MPYVLNVTTNGTLYGDTATAFCEDGYRLTGTFNNSITTQNVLCQSDGMWEEMHECEPKGILLCNAIVVFSALELLCHLTNRSSHTQHVVWKACRFLGFMFLYQTSI